MIRLAPWLVASVLSLAGCVERTISITSSPQGALVWLNDREVGRTPVEVAFVHYGTYDVRLECAGHEPLLTSGRTRAPLWDIPGLDLLAEVAPGRRRVRLEWHYDLELSVDDPAALLERAARIREQAGPDASAGPAPHDGDPDADSRLTNGGGASRSSGDGRRADSRKPARECQP